MPTLTADADSSTAQKKRKLVNKTDIKLATSTNNSTFESTVSSILGCTMLEGMLRIPLMKGTVSLQDRKQGNQYSVAELHSATSSGTDVAIEIDYESYWTMEGLISYAPGAAPGGAVARELQLLSINDRPVEILPSFSRMINDTWKGMFPSAAGGKRPACVLALRVPPQMVDVNVSPDKREVILTNEDVIREALERTLIDLWTKQVSGVFAPHQAKSSTTGEIEKLHQRQIQQKASETIKTISLPTAVNKFSPDAKSMVRGNGVSRLADNQLDAIGPNKHFVEHTTKTMDEGGAVSSLGCLLTETLVTQASNLSVSPQPLKQQHQKMPRRNAVIHDYRHMSTAQPDISMHFSPISGRVVTESVTVADDGFSGNSKTSSPTNIEGRDQDGHSVSPIRIQKTQPAPDDVSAARSKTRLSPLVVLPDHRGSNENISVTEKPEYSEAAKVNSARKEKRSNWQQNQTKNVVWSSFAGNDDILRQFKVTRDRMRSSNRALRKCYSSTSLSSDVDHISKDIAPGEVGESVGTDNEDFYSGSIPKRESHKISLSKEDFNHMTIVGQFNCGFILAICKNFHLWILDQ
jgi:DNA mismatch repair ATPase MutL